MEISGFREFVSSVIFIKCLSIGIPDHAGVGDKG